jgi:hypothetical protein
MSSGIRSQFSYVSLSLSNWSSDKFKGDLTALIIPDCKHIKLMKTVIYKVKAKEHKCRPNSD